jgi:hypothetical protein
MIDVTGIDLIRFVKKVYDLSFPQGLGFLHFQSGSLKDEEAKVFIHEKDKYNIVDMDYVKGRSCKMNIFKQDNKWFIKDSWYDHTDKQLQELLLEFNIKIVEKKEHNIACNCNDCKKN